MTMSARLSNLRSRDLFFILAAFQLIFITVVFLDVSIVRQVVVFLYLGFVPGFLILKVFNFRNLQQLDIILFSLGFSIVFLMIAGLLVNGLFSTIGLPRPLSTMPLMIFVNSVILLLSLSTYVRDRQPNFQFFEAAKSIKKGPLVFLFLALPVLTLAGSILNNSYGNNSILLFVIASIALLFVAGLLSKKILPPKFYPLAVLAIAISLLFIGSLFSNYVQAQGSDIYNEMNVFKITLENSIWNSVPNQPASLLTARYNDMLSITIFPTIFSNLANMDPQWIMKILYPLLFSFVPLVLYRVWAKQFGTKIALASAFIFMAEQTFYMEMLGLGRQIIAELFFALLFLVLLSKEMAAPKKFLCFLVFGFALIVSHYAMAVLFLFFILSSYVLSLWKKKGSFHVPRISWIVLFAVLMFSWYVYTSGGATFNSILQFGNYVLTQAREFANPTSRGATVLRGLGLEASPSIWNSVSRVFAYLTEVLIGLGFLGLFLKRKQDPINQGYFRFVLPSMILLAALVLIPGLAGTLNITRFYHILLFFLAPLFALGGVFIANFAFKRKTELVSIALALIVIVPYFLFQTNFVYEVVKSDSWSLPLSGYRMDGQRLYSNYIYIDGQSLYGARWLSDKIPGQKTTIYADEQAWGSSIVYAGLANNHPTITLSNVTIVRDKSMVYLNRLNVVYGIVDGTYSKWNTIELSFLGELNLVYSNGACEVYDRP